MRNYNRAYRLQASPHRTEAAVKIARQVRNNLFRPSSRARRLLAVKAAALETGYHPGCFIYTYADTAGDVAQRHIDDGSVEHLH
jgi:hypothetical protein